MGSGDSVQQRVGQTCFEKHEAPCRLTQGARRGLLPTAARSKRAVSACVARGLGLAHMLDSILVQVDLPWAASALGVGPSGQDWSGEGPVPRLIRPWIGGQQRPRV